MLLSPIFTIRNNIITTKGAILKDAFFSFHIIQFNVILKYGPHPPVAKPGGVGVNLARPEEGERDSIWITSPSKTSILISIKPCLNLYTVHSLKYYDITTKIAFTKNQLSPDNS